MMQVFQEVKGSVEDLYKTLWGNREDLGDTIITSVPVPFIDYDNEIQTDSTAGDQPETTESQKTFEIMETNEILAVFGMKMGMTRLLVRDEYKLVEKAIGTHQRGGRGGMMITGQPGIGKTFCLILVYLLVLRLLKKMPTFYQRTATLTYLFCEEGVYTFSPEIALHAFFDRRHLWFSDEGNPVLLIDSNNIFSSLPELFCGRSMGVFVVQAASPTRNQGYWMKGSGAVKHVMNPWTWSEMVTGNTLQELPLNEIHFLREVFETLGPSARSCFDTFDATDLVSKVEDIRLAAFDHPLEIITKLVNKSETTHASHEIISVRSKDETRRHSVNEFGSVAIARICFEAWKDTMNEEPESSRMFALFTAFSRRILVGVLFEGMVHKALTRTDLRLTVPSRGRRLKYLGGNAGRYNFKMSAASDIAFPQIPRTLQLKHFSLGTDHIRVVRDLYYKPDYPNCPTAESFFIDESGRITLIQIPVAQEHSIKYKRLEALQDRLLGIAPATNQKPWQIVFVVPEGQEGKFGVWVDQAQWAKKLEVTVLPLALEGEPKRDLERLGGWRLTD